MSKIDYNKSSMSSKESISLDKTANFFLSLPYFSALPKSRIMYLHFIFSEECYKRGEIIYSQGSEANKVYIVKTGDFDVYYIYIYIYSSK